MNKNVFLFNPFFLHICTICVCKYGICMLLGQIWLACCDVLVFIALCVCICMLKLLLHYSLSAFVMFCETWVLLCPGGTLIFHHAVCHITLYDMKVNVYILCCTLSIHLPPLCWNSPTTADTHSPIAAHALLINAGSSLDQHLRKRPKDMPSFWPFSGTLLLSADPPPIS